VEIIHKGLFLAVIDKPHDNWDVNINKKYWMVKQIGEGESSNRVFTTYKEIKQHVEK
jgi:hypothetical protein